MKIYGVFGYPLSHSKSKFLFDDQFDNSKEVSFLEFEFDSILKFYDLIKNQTDIHGFNVTSPYKKEIISILHDQASEVKNIGACNTVKIERTDNGFQLKGYNTDVIGFMKSLDKLDLTSVKHAYILGTGGASNAITYVLESLKMPFTLISRTPITNIGDTESYQYLFDEMDLHYSLIINCTPVGTSRNNELIPIPYSKLNSSSILYDLVYNPEKSPFLTEGSKFDAVTTNGWDMLKIQAYESWKIWGLV